MSATTGSSHQIPKSVLASRPASTAQLIGGAVAIVVLRILYPDVTPEEAANVVVPHDDGRATTDEQLVSAVSETR